MAFSQDGQFVASGGMDGKVFVAYTSTGQPVCPPLETEEVVWLKWHPRGTVLLVATADGTVWMYKLPSGSCMHVLAGHQGPVSCGGFTNDGKRVVSAGEDGSLTVWDPKSGQPLFRQSSAQNGRFHREGITCLAVNKDDSLILTGGADNCAKLLNLSQGTVSFTFSVVTWGWG